ncbi:RuvB-like protein 1, partial [Cladochytrium tenue]
GTEDLLAPHGIPVDLLDRVLIIRTLPYTHDEIKIIITIRAKTEGLKVSDEAVEHLADVGVRTSLRYALQLLTPANVMARINGQAEIALGDVEEAESLFLDAKASARMLQDHADRYISPQSVRMVPQGHAGGQAPAPDTDVCELPLRGVRGALKPAKAD